MNIELVHEPGAGRLSFVLRCHLPSGTTVEVGYPDEASAQAGRREFAAAIREAFRT